MERKKEEPAHTSNAASSHGASALLDQVELKSHTASNATIDPSLLSQPLGEAPIGMSNAAQEEDPFLKEIKKDKERKATEKTTPTGSDAKRSGSAGSFANPAVMDLPPEKKQEAAANLAKLTLIGYENAANFFDGRLQISERKLMRIRTAGKIDMDTPIPVETGTVPFEEFVATYNEQTKGTISVDQKFKDDVEPLLTSIFAKRGQGLSEEQMLIGLVAQHVIVNSQKFIASQQTFKAFLAYATEQSKLAREGKLESTRPGMNAPSSAIYQPASAEGPQPNRPADIASPVVLHQEDPGYQEYLRWKQQQSVENGAAQFEMRNWGAKENIGAIDKANRMMNKRGNVRTSTINAEEPEKRRRVGGGSRKNKKK
jgi:hypothetical protein